MEEYIEDQFVPQKESLEMKELGYKKKSFACYRHKSLFLCNPPLDVNTEKVSIISAPLWQQAFDWFRTEYGLMHYITTIHTYEDDTVEFVGYSNYIKNLKKPEQELLVNKKFYKETQPTYEEARLDGIRELIKIINPF